MSFNLANIFEFDSFALLLADSLLAIVFLGAGFILFALLRHLIGVLAAQSGKKYRPSSKYESPPF